MDHPMTPRFTLHHGNCLDIMPTLAPGSVDLVITSPPYDNLRDYNGNNSMWSENVWKQVIKDLFIMLKPGGVVVWVVGDATVDGSETGTSFSQALFAKSCGFNLHDTMIWNKCNFTAVGALRHSYAPVFEYMFVWSKGRPKSFYPIKDRVNKHFGVKYHQTVRQRDGSTKDGHGRGEKTIREYGQRHNVWSVVPEKSNKKRFHPAQYPEQIPHDHIISWSNAGDTVLDPFMGSGTTGVACMNTGRNFIGIELDPGYFEIAKRRIESAAAEPQNQKVSVK